MKTVHLTALAALLGVSAQAQVITLDSNQAAFAPVAEALSACYLAPGSITQSDDCSINRGVSCAASEVSTDGSYLRRFLLASDHGLVAPYEVFSVDFGVRFDVSAPAPPFNPVTVTTYAIPTGDALVYANMTLLDTTTFDLDGSNAGTIVTARVGGTVDPATDDLVVEVRSFDHLAAGTGGRFALGANDLGQTRPSYFAAPDCGVFEPVDLAAIGFPDTHHVMVVNSAFEVMIDHKPGGNPNCGLANGGVTSVAIFSEAGFDATQVDESTVVFGAAPASRCTVEDAPMENPTGVFTTDGVPDLVCKFHKADVGLPGDGEDCIDIELTAELLDGTPIFGTDHACMAGGPTCEAGTPVE